MRVSWPKRAEERFGELGVRCVRQVRFFAITRGPKPPSASAEANGKASEIVAAHLVFSIALMIRFVSRSKAQSRIGNCTASNQNTGCDICGYSPPPFFPI